jgi:hypothetical protein
MAAERGFVELGRVAVREHVEEEVTPVSCMKFDRFELRLAR